MTNFHVTVTKIQQATESRDIETLEILEELISDRASRTSGEIQQTWESLAKMAKTSRITLEVLQEKTSSSVLIEIAEAIKDGNNHGELGTIMEELEHCKGIDEAARPALLTIVQHAEDSIREILEQGEEIEELENALADAEADEDEDDDLQILADEGGLMLETKGQEFGLGPFAPDGHFQGIVLEVRTRGTSAWERVENPKTDSGLFPTITSVKRFIEANYGEVD